MNIRTTDTIYIKFSQPVFFVYRTPGILKPCQREKRKENERCVRSQPIPAAMDNSMEFVRYALASEGNCLEADIRRNRDGELILSHDETAEEAVRLGQVFELLKEKPEKSKKVLRKERKT